MTGADLKPSPTINTHGWTQASGKLKRVLASI
jgi:hypothetical protein